MPVAYLTIIGLLHIFVFTFQTCSHAPEKGFYTWDRTLANIIPCILSVPCVRRTERQNANRDSGRNNPTTQHTRCNQVRHLILRTHRTQHIILRTHWTQYLILRTLSSARPHPSKISEGSPLYRFLTLVTWVTTDFKLLNLLQVGYY